MSTAEYTAEYMAAKAEEVAQATAAVPESHRRLYDLALQLRDLKEKKDKATEYLKKVNLALERIQLTEIPDAMAEADIRTVTFKGVGRLQMAPDVYVSFSEHKEEAFDWLRDNGFSNCISETANASTLKAIFRKKIKEGEPLPDEIFKIVPFTRATLVKA